MMKRQNILPPLPFKYRRTAEVFEKTFKLEFIDYVDRIMFIGLHEVHLDLVKYDDAIHNLLGDKYPMDGISLREVIHRYYGEEAVEMIEKLI